MAYESTFYIVERYGAHFKETIDGKEYYIAKVLAEFDLCRIGNTAMEFVTAAPVSETVFLEYECKGFDDFGRAISMLEYVTKDRAGYPLREMSVADAKRMLMTAEGEEHYRRYLPMLGALMALNENEFGKDDIRVIHYGH